MIFSGSVGEYPLVFGLLKGVEPMKKTISSKEWLEILGKELLQDFQDAFAKVHGLSVCFLDTHGLQLTNWSNPSLLCHNMMRGNRERCTQEFQDALATVQRHSQCHICKCYMGLNFALCPVWYADKLVAIVCVGGLICDTEAISDEILKNFHIPLLTYSHLTNIIDLLTKTLLLFNSNTIILANENAPYLQVDPEKELKLLDERITKRETEVAGLICQGLSNRQIAEQLFISEKTVKTHVSNILLKLGIKDRMQLVVKHCRIQN